MNGKSKHLKLEDIPLAASIRRLDVRRDPGLLFFYILLLLINVFIFSIAVLPSSQKLMMRKFHLTLEPFERWALCQFVPSMYNFKNETFISFKPLNINLEVTPSTPVQHLTLNHYPLRPVYFTTYRQSLVVKAPVYVALRSTYSNLEMVTSYVVESNPQRIELHYLNDYERSKN